MLQELNGPAGSRAGPTRPPRFGWGARRSTARRAAVVSDEQILALVTGADGLSRRQRDREVSTAAGERLLRLDWAVRAGRLALADRAARGLTSTSGSAPARQVAL